MELDDSSRLSTPPEMEPVMDCSLVLTTLSGVTIKVSLSVAKFDRFEDLEDQVMDYLASVTDSRCLGAPSTFYKLPHRHTLRTQSGTGYSKAWHTPLSSRIAVSSCHHRNNSKVALSIRFRLPFMSL